MLLKNVEVVFISGRAAPALSMAPHLEALLPSMWLPLRQAFSHHLGKVVCIVRKEQEMLVKLV